MHRGNTRGGAGAGYVLYKTAKFAITGKGHLPTNKEIGKALLTGATIGATFGAALAENCPANQPQPSPQNQPNGQQPAPQSNRVNT
jgi:hypothetical protein